ncbi:FAD-dependent oxidoreductase [Mesorhizobium sp. Z1-4]|uniref:NAD(P)/FAD-dependent oxidoreductase n=1 Tax=Mesorhizobium sp. Z1-4 TaxID=2448478 RepID=UPI000FD6BAEC|nr:FAD-dependent oxidoreductase [Mesorhizobium sp. Z1-4]
MTQSSFDVVIIGAGHGGVELAAALRQHQYSGSIALISDQPDLPYQRPPLSKDYIKRAANTPALVLKPENFYADNAIDLRLGVKAEAVDRESCSVALSDGTSITYGHLVFATGARNRKPPVPGLVHPNVLELRTLADANRIVQALPNTTHIAVVGGGFIGLEAASLLRGMGIGVDVIEMAPRLMQRAVSEPMSEWFLAHHRGEGSTVHLSTSVAAVDQGNGGADVQLSSGGTVKADAVLLAAGVQPNTDIAEACGLEVANGILVDEHLVTSDPAISAIGDCAAYPSVHLGGMARLEAVQNAVDHARCVAGRLTGQTKPYAALPWFWSIQGAARLQIAGLSRPGLNGIIRRGADESRFSVFLYDGEELVAVESVNSPADHMAARKLIGSGIELTPQQAGDPAFDLKALISARG